MTKMKISWQRGRSLASNTKVSWWKWKLTDSRLVPSLSSVITQFPNIPKMEMECKLEKWRLNWSTQQLSEDERWCNMTVLFEARAWVWVRYQCRTMEGVSWWNQSTSATSFLWPLRSVSALFVCVKKTEGGLCMIHKRRFSPLLWVESVKRQQVPSHIPT